MINRLALVLSLLLEFWGAPIVAQDGSLKELSPNSTKSELTARPTVTTQDIRHWTKWNVGKTVTTPSDPASVSYNPGIYCKIPSQSFFQAIRLSKYQGGGCVAVIVVPLRSDNDLPQLKPNCDHGSSPQLKDLTPSEADQLWGIDATKTDVSDKRTYDLVSQEGNQYIVDLVFDGNRLQKYALHSAGFVGRWYQVQPQ